MKIIVIANPKGGVAKTRTVLTLADWLAAEHGKNVLVVDMDQQASATKHLVRNYAEVERLTRGTKNIGTICALLLANNEPQPLREFAVPRCGQILASKGGISLIAASHYLDALDHHFNYQKDQKQLTQVWLNKAVWQGAGALAVRLRDYLTAAAADFDYVLIDTPAGYRCPTLAALFAADELVIPTIPDDMSFGEINELLDILVKLRCKFPTEYKPCVVFSKYQMNTSHDTLKDQLVDIHMPGADSDRCHIIAKPFLQRGNIAAFLPTDPHVKSFQDKYDTSASPIKSFASALFSKIEKP